MILNKPRTDSCSNKSPVGSLVVQSTHLSVPNTNPKNHMLKFQGVQCVLDVVFSAFVQLFLFDH